MYETFKDAMFMTEAGTIREATDKDIPNIIALEKKCFLEEHAYSAKQLTYLIKEANSCCLVETYGELIRGLIIILFKRGTKVAGIETVNVDPAFQNKGIGKQLIKAAEIEALNKGMKHIRLEVSVGNTQAIKVYEKSGYVITGLLKDYYQFDHFGSKDAYRMKKTF